MKVLGKALAGILPRTRPWPRSNPGSLKFEAASRASSLTHPSARGPGGDKLLLPWSSSGLLGGDYAGRGWLTKVSPWMEWGGQTRIAARFLGIEAGTRVDSPIGVEGGGGGHGIIRGGEEGSDEAREEAKEEGGKLPGNPRGDVVEEARVMFMGSSMCYISIPKDSFTARLAYVTPQLRETATSPHPPRPSLDSNRGDLTCCACFAARARLLMRPPRAVERGDTGRILVGDLVLVRRANMGGGGAEGLDMCVVDRIPRKNLFCRASADLQSMKVGSSLPHVTVSFHYLLIIAPWVYACHSPAVSSMLPCRLFGCTSTLPCP